MQFTSIAVAAAMVASVVANPTTPPPPTTSCSNTNKQICCTGVGGLFGQLGVLQCLSVLSGSQCSGGTQYCCPSSTTNQQVGLVNVNALQSLNCIPVTIL